MLELTVPMEDNIVQRHVDKKSYYSKLLDDLYINQRTGQIFGLEVGSRGYEAKSFCFALRKLGLGQEVVQRLRMAVSLMCMRCSYSIYLLRKAEIWRPWEHHQLTRARNGDYFKNPSVSKLLKLRISVVLRGNRFWKLLQRTRENFVCYPETPGIQVHLKALMLWKSETIKGLMKRKLFFSKGTTPPSFLGSMTKFSQK